MPCKDQFRTEVQLPMWPRILHCVAKCKMCTLNARSTRTKLMVKERMMSTHAELLEAPKGKDVLLLWK